jgi:DNA-binding NtrC family response regulator
VNGKDVRPVILVVDDEPGVRESFRAILKDRYEVLEAEDGPSSLELVGSHPVNLVLLDVRLPGMEGIQVLERVKTIDEGIEVIMVTAVKTIRTAVEAIRLGAYDYITKPFEVEEILSAVNRVLEKQALEREVLYLRSELSQRDGFDDIVGRHEAMTQIYDLISHVAETTVTVLITGESGTGKELIARAIHRQGPRRNKPFVTVNGATIPEHLLETELFGHEKGAFTSAYYKKIGKFELATGGTLFLDEVGNLRLDLQAKLLRVLQEREFERVGGVKPIKVDVRIIAATNINLRRAVSGGLFREDLFYRLNVVHIHVPPLRERREDIPLLVEHFLKKYNQQFGKAVGRLSRAALTVLQSYEWPGNVRELENIIERSVALARGSVIHLEDLPLELVALGRVPAGNDPIVGLALKRALRQFERQFIFRVMERVEWNQTHAARILGLHRNTLLWKLQTLGITRPPSEA